MTAVAVCNIMEHLGKSRGQLQPASSKILYNSCEFVRYEKHSSSILVLSLFKFVFQGNAQCFNCHRRAEGVENFTEYQSLNAEQI